MEVVVVVAVDLTVSVAQELLRAQCCCCCFCCCSSCCCELLSRVLLATSRCSCMETEGHKERKGRDAGTRKRRSPGGGVDGETVSRMLGQKEKALTAVAAAAAAPPAAPADATGAASVPLVHAPAQPPPSQMEVLLARKVAALRNLQFDDSATESAVSEAKLAVAEAKVAVAEEKKAAADAKLTAAIAANADETRIAELKVDVAKAERDVAEAKLAEARARNAKQDEIERLERDANTASRALESGAFFVPHAPHAK